MQPRQQSRVSIPRGPAPEPKGGFPSTRQSIVLGAQSGDKETRDRALDLLIAAYWRPVYRYLRIQWRTPHEDAGDLTQEFFARVVDGRTLSGYDPGRARFRTYLRVCLDGFVANERKASRRLKRGGAVSFVSLDFAGEDADLRTREIADPVDAEACFRQEWVRSLFGLAVDELREECAASGRKPHFTVFDRYDLDDLSRPSYAELAHEMGLTPATITNYLAYARRRFRQIVLRRLREMSGSEEEFRAEARELLGIE